MGRSITRMVFPFRVSMETRSTNQIGRTRPRVRCGCLDMYQHLVLPSPTHPRRPLEHGGVRCVQRFRRPRPSIVSSSGTGPREPDVVDVDERSGSFARRRGHLVRVRQCIGTHPTHLRHRSFLRTSVAAIDRPARVVVRRPVRSLHRTSIDRVSDLSRRKRGNVHRVSSLSSNGLRYVLYKNDRTRTTRLSVLSIDAHVGVSVDPMVSFPFGVLPESTDHAWGHR